MPPILQSLLLLLFPAGVLAAALKDATSYTIPNRLSAALAVAFLPAALAVGLAWPAFGLCVGLGAAALAVGVGMFSLGWLGGGDAKLMAACALWLGPPAILPFLLWTAVGGGALAVGLLAARRLPQPAIAAGPAWMGRLLQPGGDVPYGVAIAAGALIAFPGAPVWQAFHGL